MTDTRSIETVAPPCDACDEQDEETPTAESGATVAEDVTHDQAETATRAPSAGLDDQLRTGGRRWSRILAYGALPALALLLALGAGYLKWWGSALDERAARAESVQAATDITIAMLSYRPDSVDRDLATASERLTGTFKNSYLSLTHDVVIPGAKQRQIAATATVPAASSVSASANHAVVLVFINQTAIIGSDPPTNTASSVRITLDKIASQWLVTAFDPI